MGSKKNLVVGVAIVVGALWIGLPGVMTPAARDFFTTLWQVLVT